jgi:hypothetical protein
VLIYKLLGILQAVWGVRRRIKRKPANDAILLQFFLSLDLFFGLWSHCGFFLCDGVNQWFVIGDAFCLALNLLKALLELLNLGSEIVEGDLRILLPHAWIRSCGEYRRFSLVTGKIVQGELLILECLLLAWYEVLGYFQRLSLESIVLEARRSVTWSPLLTKSVRRRVRSSSLVELLLKVLFDLCLLELNAGLAFVSSGGIWSRSSLLLG